MATIKNFLKRFFNGIGAFFMWPFRALKGRSRASIAIWSTLAVLIILLGAGTSYVFFTDPGGRSPIATIQNFFGKILGEEERGGQVVRGSRDTTQGESGQEIVARKPTILPGRHVVQEGENLWSIIQKGKLLDNPWHWKQIIDQNRDAFDSIVYSDVTRQWTALIETGQELEMEAREINVSKIPIPKKYALQVLAVPPEERQRGFEIVRDVLKTGFPGYLTKTKVKGQDFYRVRIGFYDNKPAANAAAKRLVRAMGSRLPNEPILVIPNEQERQGEVLVLGVQRYRPWAVELTPTDSHQKALETLEEVEKEGEFAYIAQRRRSPSGVFSYVVRIGYFVTRKEAEAFLEDKAGKDSWKGARPRALMIFREAMPGQRIAMSSR